MSKPPLKGLAKAIRRARMHVHSYEVVTREAEEILFASAEVLSEGTLRETRGGRSYFGSTMITLNLDAVSWREPLDEEARNRLLRAVQGSVRFRVRAMRLAYEEAARRVRERPVGTALIDTKVRLSGRRLCLDVDLELPLRAAGCGARS